MKKNINPFIVDGFQVEGQCRDDSFYIRFNDEDIEELALYASDMGYVLEPEDIATDSEHPMRFKITAKTDPAVYGWISKVMEKVGDQWQDSFLYGFYRHGSFRNKYPITFNVNSQQMRGMLKRSASRNPNQTTYFRTLFGILDLEPECNPLDFILSWLWSVRFQRI